MSSTRTRREVRLHGLPVSPGLALGRVYLVDLPVVNADAGPIPPQEIERELTALREAVATLKAEHERALGEATGVEREIRRTHLMLLEDPSLLGELERAIAEHQLNLPAAIQRVVADFQDRFARVEDHVIRERLLDIRDVCTQLLNVHIERYQRGLLTPDEPVVVAARDLLPSQAARLDRHKLLGIVSELGGATSHTAILARAYGVPAVCGVAGLLEALHPAARVLVDGDRGLVVVDPSPETAASVAERLEAFAKSTEVPAAVVAGPVRTRDGVEVTFLLNVNRPEDVTEELLARTAGIGLFRTEYYFMRQDRLPSEEEQYGHYRRLLARARGKEVVVRVLDAGGDKEIRYLRLGRDENPMLGYRSTRFFLKEPAVLLPQLRALLRAACHGDLRLMFPFVTTREEVLALRDLVRQAGAALARERVPHRVDVPLGVLVEVPAAALAVETYCDVVDFLSVGTNDLTQYTLAVDRGNPRVADLFQPFHPAMLTLLARLVRVARRRGLPVSVCGELAGEPLGAALLVGLGYRRLSVSPYLLPEAQAAVRRVHAGTWAKLARRARRLAGAGAVVDLLRQGWTKGEREP